LKTFRFRPIVSDTEIAMSERQLAVQLPRDYVEFLKQSNGGEGFVGRSACLILWNAENLAEMQRAYEVDTYAPGLLIFGSDGGGEAYGFDTRVPNWPVVSVPFVGMSWELARPVGASFTEFLAAHLASKTCNDH
jgi:SMI1-KNR4 cell-wall